jgi:hypothetical protein
LAIVNDSKTAPDSNLLSLINLAINFKSNELNIGLGRRVLQTTPTNSTTPTPALTPAQSLEEIKKQIKGLLSLTNSFISNFVSTKSDLSTNSSILLGNVFVSAQIGVNTAESMADFSNSTLTNKLVSVDITECLKKLSKSSTASLIVSKLDYNSGLNKFLDMTDLTSSKIFLEVRDFNTRNKIDISSCADDAAVTIKYPLNKSQNSAVNLANYRKWKDMGVDVYKSTDPVYDNRCNHLGDNLPFDTTLDYRRFKIFQNNTITCQGADCSYEGLDSNGWVLCKCKNIKEAGIANIFDKYTFAPAPDANLDVFLCPHIAFIKEQVYKNAGFWVGLFMLLGLIIIFSIHTCIFNSYIKDHSHRLSALVYDGIISRSEVEDYDDVPNTVPGNVGVPKKNKVMDTEVDNGDNDGKPSKNKDSNIEVKQTGRSDNSERKKKKTKEFFEDKRTFGETFMTNLYDIHPVMNLSYHSLIVPFGVKVSLFIFNCFMYFSFNSFIFTENYMTKRIDDEGRVITFFLINKFRLISDTLWDKNSARSSPLLPLPLASI